MANSTTYMDFETYLREGEPSQRERAANWSIATGLQAVDGLKVSNYLYEVAAQNIEGTISADETCKLIREYYVNKSTRTTQEEEEEEADRVSANIARILATRSFDFSTNGYISLHRRIFDGIFKHAGRVRDYDISKKEWVLEGDTVCYLNWEDLRRALDYDIQQEKEFSYKGLSETEIVNHLTQFVSGIWQIHAFCEGNTRTTAVFTIQYLRSIGFAVNNEMFAKHSWYFRNALVRANYKNARLGIDYTPVYLERFFSNLLLNDGWVLQNRYLHIAPPAEWKEQPNLSSTGQVQDKYRTSSQHAQDKSALVNPYILQLIRIIGNKQLSVKEMMSLLQLKGRDNFLVNYLNPAIEGGYVGMLFPDSPRHPRQKYQLTVKGQTLATR